MERLNDPSKVGGDFLDQAIDDMETESSLTAEHDATVRKEKIQTPASLWEEYKSMTLLPNWLSSLRSRKWSSMKRLEFPTSSLILFRKGIERFPSQRIHCSSWLGSDACYPAAQLNPETF
ncbi:hypothetical protein OIU77_028511 [Salix suchowensis]|uniref:Uncharacterized protein n=1 Tax=Salix suchowensis TaxID=1278906 RepID=A0ABQ9BJS5_9ROSI|nr:hypothetical protein OIU77_028511 [Salix suchowensis]